MELNDKEHPPKAPARGGSVSLCHPNTPSASRDGVSTTAVLTGRQSEQEECARSDTELDFCGHGFGGFKTAALVL